MIDLDETRDAVCPACDGAGMVPRPRWVILHVPGRQTYAGRLTELGHGLFRLDVPEVAVPQWRQVPAHTIPAWGFTFGPSAVFQLIDVTEAAAREVVALTKHAHPEWERPAPVPPEPDEHGHRWASDATGSPCQTPGCQARRGMDGFALPCPSAPGPDDAGGLGISGVGPNDVDKAGRCRKPLCRRPLGHWHVPDCPLAEIPF